MFPEPTSTALAAWAGALSAIVLAIFGVDYYSLLYGLVGAMVASSLAEKMGRGRAIVYVTLSTLVGAVIGNLATTHLQLPGRIWLIFSCLIGGLVAQGVASVIFKAAPGLTGLLVRGVESALSRWIRGGKP